MSDGSITPLTKTLFVTWAGVEDTPIQMANQFLVQVDAIGGNPDQLVLAVGQLMSPPVIGTDDQQRAALEAISEVHVHTLARYSITPARLRELVKLLEGMATVFSEPADAREAAS